MNFRRETHKGINSMVNYVGGRGIMKYRPALVVIVPDFKFSLVVGIIIPKLVMGICPEFPIFERNRMMVSTSGRSFKSAISYPYASAGNLIILLCVNMPRSCLTMRAIPSAIT